MPPAPHPDEHDALESALVEFGGLLESDATIDFEEFVARHGEVPEESLRAAVATRFGRHDSTKRGAPAIDPALETVVRDPETDSAEFPRPFGRYRLLERLGRGAMGEVFLADDESLDRRVALKTPRIDRDDPEQLERFRLEARAAARTRHGNLCPVHDVGEIDGRPYLTMAYIAGRPLSALLEDSGPLDENRAVAIALGIARGLAAAHENGVVHRDLKPANVMLDPDDEPIVMDFGLARVERIDAARLTSEGALLGTPAYMAPEQIAGERKRVGPASDQYALGVLLFRMLTGRLPFDGAVGTVLAKAASEAPPVPRSIRGDIDPALERICLRLLAKAPEDRFESMDSVVEALELRDSPRATRSAPASRTRFPTAVAISMIALGLCLLAGVIVLSLRTPHGTVRIEVDDPNVEVRIAGETITVDDAGRPVRITPGEHALVVQRGNFKFTTPKFSIGKGDNPRITVSFVDGEATARLGERVLDRRPLPGTGDGSEPPVESPPAVPAPGLALEAVGAVGLVHVFDPSPNSESSDSPPIAHAGGLLTVDVSGDGRRLVSGGRDNRVKVWDLATGRLVHDLPGHEKEIRRVRVSPDGQSVLSSSTDWSIRLWSLSDGSLQRRFVGHDEMVSGLAFFDDGNAFVSSGFDRSLIAWRTGSGARTATLGYGLNRPVPNVQTVEDLEKLEGHVTWIRDVASTRDGKWFYSAGNDTIVLRWDAATGRVDRRMIGHRAVVNFVCLAPDESRLISTGYDNVAIVWSSEGELVRPLEGHAAPVLAAAFSSDGAFAITGSADNTIRVWDLATGETRHVLEGHTGGINELVFLPGFDDRLVASAGLDGTLRLWRLPEFPARP